MGLGMITGSAYILLLAGWLAALVVLFGGVGLLIRRWAAPGALTGSVLLFCPWLGWAAGLAVLQVWHLWLPADGRALAFIAVLGAGGLLAHVRPLAAWLGKQDGRRIWLLVIAVLAALWVAEHSAVQPAHPDSALYHVPSVKWACAYPVVPGIGNLRNILAYNSSYFLYAAMLNSGPFVDRYHHLTSALLVLLVLLKSLAACWRLVVERAKPACALVFDALLLVPALLFAMGVYAGSPSPDVGVWVLTVVVSSELIRLLDGTADSAAAGRAGAVVLLAAAGVTVKLSFVAFGMAAVVVALAAAGTLPGRRLAPGPAAWAWLTAVFLAVGLPWIARGVIQSGYPAYPCTVAGFPVEWRMDAEAARRNVDWLLAWGRMPESTPDQVLGNWRWVWPWLNRVMREGLEVATCLSLIALALFLRLFCRTGAEKDAGSRRLLLFLIAPCLGLAYWFLTSPQVRFASGTFWALGLGALAIGLRGMQREKTLAVIFCFSFTLFVQAADPFEFVRPWHRDAGPVRRGHVVPASTRWGLTVYIPATQQDGCWNAPLPNTSGAGFLDPNLRLRVPGDLSKGFVIDAR